MHSHHGRRTSSTISASLPDSTSSPISTCDRLIRVTVYFSTRPLWTCCFRRGPTRWGPTMYSVGLLQRGLYRLTLPSRSPLPVWSAATSAWRCRWTFPHRFGAESTVRRVRMIEPAAFFPSEYAQTHAAPAKTTRPHAAYLQVPAKTRLHNLWDLVSAKARGKEGRPIHIAIKIFCLQFDNHRPSGNR